MSQRTFTYGNLNVFTGWDQPLDWFFLVIERQDATEEGYLFSNLRRKNPGMTLEEIKEELTKAGIHNPPPTLLDDLEQDRKMKRANFVQGYFQLNGAWRTSAGSAP